MRARDKIRMLFLPDDAKPSSDTANETAKPVRSSDPPCRGQDAQRTDRQLLPAKGWKDGDL